MQSDQLMLNDADKSFEQDSEGLEEQLLVIPPDVSQKKKAKASQITDFTQSRKKIKKGG